MFCKARYSIKAIRHGYKTSTPMRVTVVYVCGGGGGGGVKVENAQFRYLISNSHSFTMYCSKINYAVSTMKFGAGTMLCWTCIHQTLL